MQSRKLNILFLSSWYPCRSHPTLGNFVQRHAEAVATLHHVTVLYMAPLANTETRFETEDYTISGVRSIVIYYKSSFASIPARYRAFQKGLEILANEKFDLIHHNVIWNSGWQAVIAARKFQIPFIITEHWTGYDTGARQDQPRFLKPFSKWIASKAAAICPVSEDLGKKMRAFGIAGNYAVVPNVVDISIFQNTPREKKTINILHVSSLNDPQKNITGILKSWKKIAEKTTKFKLCIGGDGPVEAYRTMAHSMEINAGSIEFFGEKTPAEIASLMQNCHVFLLFSNYENLPVVLVEAMASGMYIISTNVGGIAEHVTPERGELIERGNTEQLVNSILNIEEKLQKFEPSQSRNYALQNFSKNSVAAQFDAVYRKVLQNRNKSV